MMIIKIDKDTAELLFNGKHDCVNFDEYLYNNNHTIYELSHHIGQNLTIFTSPQRIKDFITSEEFLIDVHNSFINNPKHEKIVLEYDFELHEQTV